MTSRAEGAVEASYIMPTYRKPPVTFVRGERCRLMDTSGRWYLDFLSGIGVCSLGHAHPRVARAISEQAGQLVHVSNLFGNPVAPGVAATLDRLIGGGKQAGGKVFFANSGAEANECAIKLARRWGGPGRHVVLSAHGSFHGRTLATLAATGQPTKREGFEPLPEGFVHVAFDDIEALDTAMDPEVVVAVLLEPVQGEGGVVPASSGYLRAVRQLCDERGVLMMVDEVQTGLARTGTWFGFQHDDVVPDVVTMAKALGNGAPIGACWARSVVAEAFRPGDHASTFGGQPLATAAARETLAVMEEIGAPERAGAAGTVLREGLSKLPRIQEVRGKGLLLAAVLEEDRAAGVTAAALGKGLVVNAVSGSAIRLAPPLIVSDAEIDEALDLLARSIAEVIK